MRGTNHSLLEETIVIRIQDVLNKLDEHKLPEMEGLKGVLLELKIAVIQSGEGVITPIWLYSRIFEIVHKPTNVAGYHVLLTQLADLLFEDYEPAFNQELKSLWTIGSTRTTVH